MARVYTDLPNHPGELEVARQLAALDDDRLHLWFGVNYIPGVPDIDVIIWHENGGVFVIEVKAVPLEEIEWYGWNRCKIARRPETQGPHQQAHRALHCLRNFLGRMEAKPFVTSGACWPRIRRRQWNDHWNDSAVCGAYAESMLFADDIYADPAALRERLEHIRLNPNMGADRQSAFTHDAAALGEFRRALDVTARPKPIQSDYERLRVLENAISEKTRREAPAYGEKRIVYSGRPGTGKTFRLLRTALYHAMEGCDVLFVCFNKVLATDIRRLLGFSERLDLCAGRIEVHDIFEMLSLFASRRQYELNGNIAEWAELVVDEMKDCRPALPKYDTILVDEGQDIRQWAYEMLELHAKESSTICVAAGDGQELYAGEADWLRDFRTRSETKRLLRVFRNPRSVFQLATLAFEAELRPDRIERAFSRFQRGAAGQAAQLTFERGPGDLPRMAAIDDSSLAALAGNPERCATEQAELMTREYAGIIRREVEELGHERHPLDLLLLVPSRKSTHYPWVIEALKVEGLGYIDYTDDSQRRHLPAPGTIRLCTYHSSRGTEGHRVILFGIEQLRKLAEYVHVDAHRLAYIVLSRAVMQLVIPYRKSAESPVSRFVQDAMACIRAHAEPLKTAAAPGRPRPIAGGA